MPSHMRLVRSAYGIRGRLTALQRGLSDRFMFYVEFLKAQGVCLSLLEKYLSVQALPDFYANRVGT